MNNEPSALRYYAEIGTGDPFRITLECGDEKDFLNTIKFICLGHRKIPVKITDRKWSRELIFMRADFEEMYMSLGFCDSYHSQMSELCAPSITR